jgi:hypothetical protein
VQAAGDIAREANEGQSGLAHTALFAKALRKAKPMSDPLVQRVADATPKKIARRIRGLSDRAIAWLFVGPTIFLLLAVNIFPLIWTIRLSLTNFRTNRPNNPVKFVGIENYQKILTDPDTWISMQATAHLDHRVSGADRLYPCMADQQEIPRQ